MIARFILALLLVCQFFFLPVYADFLRNRPVEIKLGYVPHPQVLRATLADQRLLYSSWTVIRTLFYYGTLIEKYFQNVIIRPEFANMYQTLQTAINLDPYNSDAYYFAQASFTWDLGRIDEVNHLLLKGMESRTWDESLPFFLGFNHAYFLKDYKNAAIYMRKAAEISNNPLYTSLAARYFYESSQVDFGLLFLEEMIKQSKDKNVRTMYSMRLDALKKINFLESKISDYQSQYGRLATTLEVLVESNLIKAIPVDPYGGTFYIDESGKVRTTSKLSIMYSPEMMERYESN